MKLRLRLRLDAVRALLALALAILSLGYLAVLRPLEAQISERGSALALAEREAAARAAVLAREPLAERALARQRATLARFHLDGDRAATLGRFLEAVLAASGRHGTTIRTLQTDSSSGSAAVRTTAAAPAFDELSLSLTLRGSYTGLLATVRDLAAAPLAARISIDTLAPDEPSASSGEVRSPHLLAALRIVLLRAPEKSHVHVDPRAS